jgi:hypothetical protein
MDFIEGNDLFRKLLSKGRLNILQEEKEKHLVLYALLIALKQIEATEMGFIQWNE